jgi:protein gp37
MNQATWHTFQILTKRPIELLRHAEELTWSANIWMGVTVESHRYVHRLDALRMVPAHIRFVSFEPLLTEIPKSISLKGIHWVIVGGESGPGARPMEENWVKGIRTLCRRYKTAFFFKQWGGINKKATGRMLREKRGTRCQWSRKGLHVLRPEKVRDRIESRCPRQGTSSATARRG